MDEIKYLGNLRGDKPQGYTGSIYKTDGIAPAILSRDYKDPSLILIEVKEDDKRKSCELVYRK